MRACRSYSFFCFALHLAFSVEVYGQCTSFDMLDENDDQHIDHLDVAALVDCLAGPEAKPTPTPPRTAEHCLFVFDRFTFNEVGLGNFQGFQNSFTGPIRSECFNIVFVSSEFFQPNLGGVAAYDFQCNQIATNHGFNNPTNNAFIAWVSDSGSQVRTRLGNLARGFVRLDARPVADTVASLLSQNALLHPINIDEWGDQVASSTVMTGTNADGTTHSWNCQNWTSTALGPMNSGNTAGGPSNWTQGVAQGCSQGPFRVYCIQKNVNRALPSTGRQGKTVYLTHTLFTPGSGIKPDAFCAQEKPAGLGDVRAIIAYTDQAAADVIDPVQEYVRPDGQFVGLGSDLINATMATGIWQTSQGVYLQSLVWTGSTSVTSPGTTTTTCNDWTSTASTQGRAGLSSYTTGLWFSVANQSCATPWRIYCIEQ